MRVSILAITMVSILRKKMLYLTWQTRMESQVTIFWEWLQLFPSLMIDYVHPTYQENTSLCEWSFPRDLPSRWDSVARGEIGDAYAQLDGRPTILTQSFLFNCFLAALGMVHRMAVPYVYWSVSGSWVLLTKYWPVPTSTAPYWPSTTKYQPVPPSTDPIPSCINQYRPMLT